jgi:hypothetical protein
LLDVGVRFGIVGVRHNTDRLRIIQVLLDVILRTSPESEQIRSSH